jgi:hypothetical protein
MVHSSREYALDALDAPNGVLPSTDDARDFVDLLLAAPCTSGRAVGLGDGLRFASGGLSGSGLVCDGELVTLTAFANEPGPSGPATPGRVERPPRRRPGYRSAVADGAPNVIDDRRELGGHSTGSRISHRS